MALATEHAGRRRKAEEESGDWGQKGDSGQGRERTRTSECLLCARNYIHLLNPQIKAIRWKQRFIFSCILGVGNRGTDSPFSGRVGIQTGSR